MSDRELLTLAAKAAGYRHTVEVCGDDYQLLVDGGLWNPLTDDGAALRLAVKLNLSIVFGANYVCVGQEQIPTINNANDPCAATRRAIVRAAAEIGRAMP